MKRVSGVGYFVFREPATTEICTLARHDALALWPSHVYSFLSLWDSRGFVWDMTYIIVEPCIGTKDASCVEVCPVLRPVEDDARNAKRFRAPATDDGYGPYSYGCYARATDPELVTRGQDGGMTSALLIHGLKTGRLGGAILGDVEPEARQIGRHRLAMNRQDVLDCAASRYTYSPNTLALQEAMRRDVKPPAGGGPRAVCGSRFQSWSRAW